MHWGNHCNIIIYCSYSIIFSHVNHAIDIQWAAIRAGKIKKSKNDLSVSIPVRI